MKSNFIIYGFVLMFVSVAGLFYASRVALAQSMYSRAKFSTPALDYQSIVNLSGKASGLYRNNYYVCILAAEAAYYESLKTNCTDVAQNIADAQHWCEEGLRLNPYRMPLRRLKACLLARTSPVDAAVYWEEFVDWQYWEPSNHELLIELCALAGRYERALESLSLIKDFPCYQNAGMKLNAAWSKEKDFPLELFGKPAK